jgi:hypothetical protein
MEQVPALHIDGHTLVESVSNGQMLNLVVVRKVNNSMFLFNKNEVVLNDDSAFFIE